MNMRNMNLNKCMIGTWKHITAIRRTFSSELILVERGLRNEKKVRGRCTRVSDEFIKQ